MTAQERDYEEILSRVLRTATDQVEPVGDGLAKIRMRLSEPWLTRQWWLLRSEFMVLGWLIALRCQSVYHMIRSRSAAPGGPGSGPPTGAGKSHSPVLNWLRPALAVAGAVVLVVAGVFALGQIRQGIVNLSGAGGGNNGPGTSSQAGAPGTTNGAGAPAAGGAPSSPTPRGTASARHGVTHHPGAQSSSPPCASPGPTPSGISPTPTPSATSPTPTPSPTVSATPTPTVTATPTGSGSPASSLQALTNEATRGTGTTVLTCGPVPSGGPSPSYLDTQN